MKLTFEEAVDRLRAPSSPDRRRAAKRLRELADPRAADALIEALDHERLDERTWETQYQMAMAIGMSGAMRGLPLLKEMALERRNHTAINTALGDAIFRLDRHSDVDVEPIYWCASPSTPDYSGYDGLTDGALRAMAMLRVVPASEDVARILALVEPLHLDDALRFWVIVAAAGWSGEPVRRFLDESLTSSREAWRKAATDSLARRYGRYHPL